MKRLAISTLALLVLIISSETSAQRSNTAAVNFYSYRPLGEIKAWTFVAKDSSIGQLFSTVKRKKRINGVDGIEIDQNLQLDYNKIGMARRLLISGNHYVSETGHYLGDEMEITVNGETEKLKLERDGNILEGYYTRGGNEIDREIEFFSEGYAADLMFLDMYENFFAMQNFKVGDTIQDSIFVPQTMLIEQVSAVIETFGLVSLYNQVRDSAFVIRLMRPQPMVLYFNIKKQLVKADYLSQQMKAYLDIIRNLPPESLAKPQFTFSKFTGLVPFYSIYLLFGALTLVFFAGANTYRLNLYLFILAGGAVFLISAFTQIPLQTYLGKEVYMSHVNSGGSAFFWAIIPAIPAGIIQELLKLGLIIVAYKFLNISKNKLLFYGGAIGAGFGIVEAAYIISQFANVEIWTMNLVERGFQILFHTSSGIILAAAVQSSEFKKKAMYISLAVMVNTWLRYIPVFAQSGKLQAELLYILQPIVPIIVMIYCVSLIKRQRAA